MRILHIDTERTWRGGENQLRLLLEGLAKTDAECHLAAPPDSQVALRLSHLAQLVTPPMRGGFNPRAARQLAKYCQAQRIDLIDAHTGHAHSLGLMVKLWRPELKLVVHRRVDYAPSPGFFSRHKYLTPKVDRFIAISAAIAGILARYGVPQQRISVVKSAIDQHRYQASARGAARQALLHAHGLAAEATLIGNASALTEQKGYEVLLDAAAILKQQGVLFHLLIAGDGPLRSALEAQRDDLGLTGQVSFLGFIDDVSSFLLGLDILAVPSHFEGLGTILLDGIAAGLAVAATAVGGIPEVIIDGVTGLLSADGDGAGHAANLKKLAASPQLRGELNRAGREHIADEFSLAAMVGGNLEVYRDVLAR